MKKVVVASTNAGKLKEFRQLLQPLDWQIVSQAELSLAAVDENAPTFVENALLKARQACEHSGLPSLADDSGIEVDSLQGAPGVRSARYAGDHATAQDNVNKLLRVLSDKPAAGRYARFRCVLVYLRDANDPSPIICQGSWEGQILAKAEGDNGFGYDPIFFVPQHGCSAAQLTQVQKNALSHRGQAMQQLLKVLSDD